MYAGNTEAMGHAAEALILAGDLPAAEKQLDDAFALAERIREYIELGNFMLLRARLALAARAGARWANAGASVGSGSHHNMERHGFRVAYTRPVLVRSL
jgi:hypothetical protein